MNRIRIYNNKYQVLITPTLPTNSSFELLIESWHNQNFLHFYIKEYEHQGDAMCESLSHPDIDWYKLVLLHKEQYFKYKKILEEIIKKNKMVVQFINTLIEPNILKNVIFDKVMNNDPELRYGLNEIICFKIVNPWSNNLKQFIKILEHYKELNLTNKNFSNGKFILNGRTDFGTSYEIILIPSLIHYLESWIQMNKEETNIQNVVKSVFPQLIKMQEEFDKTPVLR